MSILWDDRRERSLEDPETCPEIEGQSYAVTISRGNVPEITASRYAKRSVLPIKGNLLATYMSV
jgi:hypothetical protein